MQSSPIIQIIHGRLLTPAGIVRDGSVLIRDGKIAGMNTPVEDSIELITIDACGRWVSPGFIDMHIHGGGGHDFMDGTIEAFLAIAATHAKYGTTALMPTTLTGTTEALHATLKAYEKANRLNTNGAQFIGMHMEGPYIAMSQRGAQDPRYIRNPDAEEYEALLAAYPFIRRWSAAPELPGALEFGRRLTARNILVALAHTDAIYEEALEGFANGFTHATHFYSAMSGITRRNAHRYAGVIETAYLLDEMTVEIIADGIHLPAPLLQLVYKIKGPDKTVLITDAMRAAGAPEGNSILGSLEDGLPVIVENGIALLPDRSSFAGSVATADRLVRNMIQLAGIPLPDAVKMITQTPAAILGINDTKGSLIPGQDADLVLFDDNIHVSTTIIGGRLVHNDTCTVIVNETKQPG